MNIRLTMLQVSHACGVRYGLNSATEKEPWLTQLHTEKNFQTGPGNTWYKKDLTEVERHCCGYPGGQTVSADWKQVLRGFLENSNLALEAFLLDSTTVRNMLEPD